MQSLPRKQHHRLFQFEDKNIKLNKNSASFPLSSLKPRQVVNVSAGQELNIFTKYQ